MVGIITIKTKNMYDGDNWVGTSIAVIIVLILIWLVVAFIAMDLGWPIHTVIGRLGAIGIVLGVIKTASED